MPNGTLSQAELRKQTVATMEDDLRITDTQAKDFVVSLIATIQDAVADGQKVSLFGICILTPGFRLAKPKRQGTDPRTGEETTFKATPQKTTIRAAVSKKIKDGLPSPSSSAGKALKVEAEARAKAAAKRAAEAAREADKPAAKKGKGKK